MNRFVKWLVGGTVALVLAGLAVLQWRAFFLKTVHDPEFDQVIYRSVQVSLPEVHDETVPVGSEMTDAERAVKQQLEDLLASREPTHRLVYDGVKTIVGRLVEEYPDHIVFAQKYGESGEMSIQLPRSRIVHLEPYQTRRIDVSLRDIRFYMEFPGKRFYKSPPYTIMAEESFFAIEHIIKQQQDLYAQFVERFGSLLAASGRKDDVQMLILANADEYSSYRSKCAPELKGSSGFYDQKRDRMTVYHQRDADWVKDGRQKIVAVEKQYEGKLPTAQARESLNQWKSGARSQLLAQADEATQEVIRHESAHQLFFTLGVQHPSQNGRGWVTEGLATFCDTEKIGQINPGRRDELKSALSGDQLISLRGLMNLPRCDSPLAYAEAWSLTRMLMQPEYRAGFFAYLDWLRKNPTAPVSDSVRELCRFLSLQSEDLEYRWVAYINQLILLK